MLATPLADPRHRRRATCCSCCSGWPRPAAVFMLVLAPFGVFESWWGPVAGLRRRQVLVGMAFAAWSTASATRLTSARRLRRAVPARRVPAVPVLRRVLPDRQPRRRAASGSPSSRRCGTASNLSRMFCVDTVDWSTGRWSTSPTSSALLVVGWFWSVSGLDEAAGDVMATTARRPAASRRSAGRRRSGCSSCATTSSTAPAGSCSSPASSSRSSTCSRSASASASWSTASSSTASRSPTPSSSRPGCSPRRRSTARCWTRRTTSSSS